SSSTINTYANLLLIASGAEPILTMRDASSSSPTNPKNHSHHQAKQNHYRLFFNPSDQRDASLYGSYLNQQSQLFMTLYSSLFTTK
ncbi:MAG: hypothetical protein Q9M16_08170, partial [Mariprofundus sp.]|nr:hypothetical protein [Mariprofundus sp.]